MFELSPEHEAFRASVRDFAEKEIAPHVAQWDQDHHFPVDVVQKMGELGLFGLTAPGGVRRRWRGWRLHLRCVSPSRSSAGSISRSASRLRPVSVWASIRSSPSDRRSRSSVAARSGGRLRARRFRPHRARVPAPTPGLPAPRPNSTAASGSSTARRRSSPTRARRSPPGDGHRPDRRARVGQAGDQHDHRARPAQRGSLSSRPIARWAGTPRTPTR